MKRVLLAACAILIGQAEPHAQRLWPEVIPQDMSNTLGQIRSSGEMKVGVVHDPPWVDITTDPPEGIEIAVMQAFAEHLGARAAWRVVSLAEGMDALKQEELHAVVGGLTRATPYTKVGYSRPYLTTHNPSSGKAHHVIALRQGENRFLVTLELFLDRNRGMIRKEAGRATDPPS